MKALKVLELFAGIGACSKALEKLNIQFEIVDAVEIDKYAIKSFNAIHNTNFEPQDIAAWDKDIEVDLIMHGSPCQDFSLAGKQAGGDKGSGTRSSLMYETLRIVEKLKPKYVIWENVKNVLSKKHKHNFDNYLSEMKRLGYTNYYQVLNAKDYGIPQNRERVFTISILDNREFEFPPKQELKLKLKDILEDEVDEKYYLSNKLVEKIKFNLKNSNIIGNLDINKWQDSMKRIYDVNKYSPTVDTCQGGNREPKILIKNNTKEGYLEAYDGDGVYTNTSTKRGTVQHNMIQTLTTFQDKGVIVKVDIPQTVRVRKYNIDNQKLVEVLRKQKELTGWTNKKLADKLNLPLTKVEHWFRTDNSFAIPDTEYWYKLKEILNITTDEFDKAIMTFEEKEGTYEKSNRYYCENGISPTLTSTNADEKIITNLRIRKLTPKECWRLMGFDDEDFEKAAKVNSNTQLYKQAGNSIVVNVLVEIFRNLLDKESEIK